MGTGWGSSHIAWHSAHTSWPSTVSDSTRGNSSRKSPRLQTPGLAQQALLTTHQAPCAHLLALCRPDRRQASVRQGQLHGASPLTCSGIQTGSSSALGSWWPSRSQHAFPGGSSWGVGHIPILFPDTVPPTLEPLALDGNRYSTFLLQDPGRECIHVFCVRVCELGEK